MEVIWNYKEKPKTNEFGLSEHLVVLTNKGAFATGYYSNDFSDWLCDGILFKEEKVVAWLGGLVEVKVAK